MTHVKKIVSGLLLLFIVFAIVVKIVSRNVPQEATAILDHYHVLLFHAEARCKTCNDMESLIKEVLQRQEYIDLGIDLVLLEYDLPKNKELVERFRVGTASIVLIEKRDGEIVRHRNLTAEAWNTIDYKRLFVEMLETNFIEFFQEEVESK
jgi:thioredoxin-related protein